MKKLDFAKITFEEITTGEYTTEEFEAWDKYHEAKERDKKVKAEAESARKKNDSFEQKIAKYRGESE